MLFGGCFADLRRHLSSLDLKTKCARACFMKKTTMLFLFCFLPAIFEPELSVDFSNIREARGNIYVAVYDRSDAFLKVERVRSKKIVQVQKTGTLNISLGTLPPGQYALSAFHDVNGNGKLDTNWAGIPNEPYGFSNNARPKFRAPNWAEAVFTWGGTGGMGIRLEKW